MGNELVTQQLDNVSMMERVVVMGDLSKLSPQERLQYYRAVCESVGLNPLTKPFDYIHLNNKLVLYAKREATDQLRSLHGVSITKLERDYSDGVYIVTAYAENKKGRTDTASGAVNVEGLKGEAKANAIMKAETKAKRRVTLSLCGLGLLDESETDAIETGSTEMQEAPRHQIEMPQRASATVQDAQPKAAQPGPEHKAPAPAPNGPGNVQGLVEQIKDKDLSTGGKMYGIVVKGTPHNTTIEAIAEEARWAAANQAEVIIQYTKNPQFGTRDLVSLVMIETTPAAAVQAEADDAY